MDLVTATDIARWADLREAQGQLPRLVRRLIAVTANGLKVISVRSGEGVAYPGWDGVVVASGADAHVPEGVSVWEMGVNANPGVKANGDHRKRTERPGDVVPTDTTFVFVTPRRWGGRADWVKERTDEGHWKRVIAFDGDDLETWLERAPSVHAWFSAQLGKDPYEAESLETWWESWIAATNPPFLPALLLSGRDAVGERIRGQVNAGAGSLALSGDSQEEVVAFIAATLIGSGVDEPLANLGRSLIVRTPGAWRRLAVSEFPLILIPLFEKADVTLATRHGHTVLLPFARGGGLGSGEELPRLRRDGLEAALLESGLSRERAGDLATLGRRSLLALRRTLAVSPEVHAPEWSRPEHARDVLPAIMAGQWNDRAEGDREAIAALADQPYDETVEHLTRWAHLSDPPVRRVGDVWLVAAKQDAWLMTARFLTTQDLERFSQVALEVLGGDDPAFDLPPGERLMASILGKQRSHSGHLLEGLADTLALIASLSDQIPLVGGRRGQEIATGVVRRLLDSANEDESGRRWISLADVLPLLAEASPDTFLNAVDAGLRGEAPIVLRMFQDGEGFNSMFGSSAHPSLLWALENVAWSPEHLGRTALLLAKLTRMDPGGRLDNRPAKSLREILLLWRPGTAATVDQKLQVVDLLRASEPDVAWPLMLDLIPSGRNTASSTHAPRRREWKQDAEAITWRDVFSAVEGLVDRAQEDAGTNGSRWATVIGRIEGLTPELRARIVERIRNMSPSDFDEAGRAHIANALRYLVGRHREYPDATWALPEHEIDEIDRLVSTFEPDAPLLRYAWLFDQGALYSFGGLDREEKREEWSTAQAQAIRAVVDAVGVDAVLVWAEQFQSLSFSAHQIGWALGSIELDPLGEDALLSQLASE